MDYSYDFAKIKADYPEKIGLEQMRVICHISKKTARYLLTSGLVPCIDTGKKTRQYIINTKDVITYLIKASIPTGKILCTDRVLLGELEQRRQAQNADLTGMGKSGYRQKRKEVSGLSYPENAALQRCAECRRSKPVYRLSP